MGSPRVRSAWMTKATSKAMPSYQRHDDGFVSDAALDADLGEPVDECRQGRGKQSQPEYVERLPCPFGISSQAPPGKGEPDHTERHVDPEHPVPAQVADDQATDDRSQNGAEQHGQADHSHRSSQRLSTGSLDKQGLHDRQHQSAAHALHDAKGDQTVHVPGEARKHRADQKQRQREEPHALAAEASHRPAADRDDHGERQHVGGDHPLCRGHPHVHGAPKRGHGHVDDGGVKDDRHGPGQQDDGELDESWGEAIVCRSLRHEP